MEYTIKNILIEPNNEKIALRLEIKTEIKTHEIFKEFNIDNSGSKGYRPNKDLLIKFDPNSKKLTISKTNSLDYASFKLKNTRYIYNDSFITKLIVDIIDGKIEFEPSFCLFEDDMKKIIGVSIESLENLHQKLSQEYQELCKESIKHLKILEKSFPCFLDSEYKKLIENLNEMGLQETKEILEIIKGSNKKRILFALGKEVEKKVNIEDIDEYSTYDEEKLKIDIYNYKRQKYPVLKKNLQTIIKILETKRYITRIDKTKLIRLKNLVKKIERVEVEPSKRLLEDIREVLKGFISILASIASPVLAFISITIEIINMLEKAEKIKQNLENKKYNKDFQKRESDQIDRQVVEEKVVAASLQPPCKYYFIKHPDGSSNQVKVTRPIKIAELKFRFAGCTVYELRQNRWVKLFGSGARVLKKDKLLKALDADGKSVRELAGDAGASSSYAYQVLKKSRKAKRAKRKSSESLRYRG
jgi:hypothetical protein